MKNLKEYKISIVMFILSLASFTASGVTGLMVKLMNHSIDKSLMFLGFGLMLLGFTLIHKAKKKIEIVEK